MLSAPLLRKTLAVWSVLGARGMLNITSDDKYFPLQAEAQFWTQLPERHMNWKAYAMVQGLSEQLKD